MYFFSLLIWCQWKGGELIHARDVLAVTWWQSVKSSIFQPLFFIVVCHCPHARMKKCIHPLFVSTWTLCLLQCFYRTNKMRHRHTQTQCIFWKTTKWRASSSCKRYCRTRRWAARKKGETAASKSACSMYTKSPFLTKCSLMHVLYWLITIGVIPFSYHTHWDSVEHPICRTWF